MCYSVSIFKLETFLKGRSGILQIDHPLFSMTITSVAVQLPICLPQVLGLVREPGQDVRQNLIPEEPQFAAFLANVSPALSAGSSPT